MKKTLVCFGYIMNGMTSYPAVWGYQQKDPYESTSVSWEVGAFFFSWLNLTKKKDESPQNGLLTKGFP